MKNMSTKAGFGSLFDEDIADDIDFAPTKNGKKTRYEPTEFWLNVGTVRNGTFLGFVPMGIPLDRLKARPVPSAQSKATPGFRMQRATEAKLWERFEDQFRTLKPGESRVIVEQVAIEVRRVEPKELTQEEEEKNPFALSDDFTFNLVDLRKSSDNEEEAA